MNVAVFVFWLQFVTFSYCVNPMCWQNWTSVTHRHQFYHLQP